MTIQLNTVGQTGAIKRCCFTGQKVMRVWPIFAFMGTLGKAAHDMHKHPELHP